MNTTTIEFEHEFEIGQRVLYCDKLRHASNIAQWWVVRGIIFTENEGDYPVATRSLPFVGYKLGTADEDLPSGPKAGPEELFADEEAFSEYRESLVNIIDQTTREDE